jgi:aryl-alcohol dehydrogenase-like predicted oxidoreductase
MRYLEVDGLRLSRIGLGTWQFASREWGYGETYARDVAPALLRRAIDLGITMIDTAEFYGFGGSERIIGDTLADLAPADRAHLTVATKFMPLAPAEAIVRREAAGSARRLRDDPIDLYYVHWPNPFVSPRRVGQAVRPLLEAGHVRRAAVSNHSVAQWQAFERGLRRPAIANQVRFSLVSPGPAVELVPFAADNGRVIVAYSPLGQGLLAGREPSQMTGMRAMGGAARGRSAELAILRTAVAEIAGANDAEPAQVSLAWLLSHPNTIAIPGARSMEQLERNAAAADLVLSTDELTRLTEASRPFLARRR